MSNSMDFKLSFKLHWLLANLLLCMPTFGSLVHTIDKHKILGGLIQGNIRSLTYLVHSYVVISHTSDISSFIVNISGCTDETYSGIANGKVLTEVHKKQELIFMQNN